MSVNSESVPCWATLPATSCTETCDEREMQRQPGESDQAKRDMVGGRIVPIEVILVRHDACRRQRLCLQQRKDRPDMSRHVARRTRGASRALLSRIEPHCRLGCQPIHSSRGRGTTGTLADQQTLAHRAHGGAKVDWGPEGRHEPDGVRALPCRLDAQATLRAPYRDRAPRAGGKPPRLKVAAR